MSFLKYFGIYPKSTYVNKGSYRADYRDEAVMKATDKDKAVLAAREAARIAATRSTAK